MHFVGGAHIGNQYPVKIAAALPHRIVATENVKCMEIICLPIVAENMYGIVALLSV
ncbi:MAG: hypothetical protein GWN14_00715, partial [candidate division Zixibacteria bacterium]|nr:hypothetical protein [candidate division Zixibacteria bacterium]